MLWWLYLDQIPYAGAYQVANVTVKHSEVTCFAALFLWMFFHYGHEAWEHSRWCLVFMVRCTNGAKSCGSKPNTQHPHLFLELLQLTNTIYTRVNRVFVEYLQVNQWGLTDNHAICSHKGQNIPSSQSSTFFILQLCSNYYASIVMCIECILVCITLCSN